MTDVSAAQRNTSRTSVKLIKSNNETSHSLTNGSTTKVNNIEKLKIAQGDQHLTTLDTATTTSTTLLSKMSTTFGIKSSTPTTQSPATTPSQTLVSYDTNTSLCSTSLITPTKQTINQITIKPALQTDKDSISPEVSVTAFASASASTSPPSIASCGNITNIVGNTTTLNSSISCSSPINKNVAKKLHEASSEDVDEVGRLFEEKPEAFEIWLMERAPPEALTRLHDFIENRKQHLKRPSVTSDLFQQWMSSSPIQKNRSLTPASNGSHLALDNRPHLMELDEGELFMELIRDVANELDIDVLCHKILVNVGLLTHADRGSLFLAKGPPNNRYLVAKLFDVTQKTQTLYLYLHTEISYQFTQNILKVSQFHI